MEEFGELCERFAPGLFESLDELFVTHEMLLRIRCVTTVAQYSTTAYNATMVTVSDTRDRGHWVLLAYRLPREPSTPRITLWRKLKRLGASQLLDGLVALPLDSRNKEQLEWLAEAVIEDGGEASIWTAQPATAAQERSLARTMAEAIAAEYRLVAEAARAAQHEPSNARRTLSRLRRELGRIRARDFFPPPEREEAETTVQALGRALVLVR
jgi:hypothetical protein